MPRRNKKTVKSLESAIQSVESRMSSAPSTAVMAMPAERRQLKLEKDLQGIRNRLSVVKMDPNRQGQAPKFELASKYLDTIVDPMGPCYGEGIPDEYGGRTKRYRSVNQFEVTPNPNPLSGLTNPLGQIFNFDGAGYFTVVVTPDLYQHVYVTSGLPASTQATNLEVQSWFNKDGATLVRQERSQAFGRAQAGTMQASYIDADYTFSAGAGNSVFFSFYFDSAATSLSQGTVAGEDAGVLPPAVTIVGPTTIGNAAFKGLPCTSYGGDFINLYLERADPTLAINLQVTSNGYNADGSAKNNPGTSVPWAVGQSAILYQCPSPGSPSVIWTSITVQLIVASGNAQCNLVAARLTWVNGANILLSSIGNPTTSVLPVVASGSILQSLPVPEYSSFDNGVVKAYRCVSSCLFITYDGGTLTDNGRVVAMQVDDRSPIYDNTRSYTTMTDLASVDGVYDDQLRTGLYGFLVPRGTEDLSWKRLNEPWNWSQPYLVASCLSPYNTVSGTRGSGTLRVKVVTNWELLTLSNEFERIATVYNRSDIDQVFRVMRDFPNMMENPMHLENIANFLKKYYGMTRKAYLKYQRPLRMLSAAHPAAGAVVRALDTVFE